MNRRDADRAAFEVTQDLEMVNHDGEEANRDAGSPFRSTQLTSRNRDRGRSRSDANLPVSVSPRCSTAS